MNCSQPFSVLSIPFSSDPVSLRYCTRVFVLIPERVAETIVFVNVTKFMSRACNAQYFLFPVKFETFFVLSSHNHFGSANKVNGRLQLHLDMRTAGEDSTERRNAFLHLCEMSSSLDKVVICPSLLSSVKNVRIVLQAKSMHVS